MCLFCWVGTVREGLGLALGCDRAVAGLGLGPDWALARTGPGPAQAQLSNQINRFVLSVGGINRTYLITGPGL